MKKLIVSSSVMVAVAMLVPFAAQAQYGGGGAPVFGAISVVGGTANPLPGASLSVPNSSNANIVPAGEVLGATTYNFTTNLYAGLTSADVSALQQFLIDEGYLKVSATTGYFGPLTRSAVMAFQNTNSLPSTGFVGPLTIAVLNKGELPTTVETATTTKSSGLTVAQANAVISLLQSFGADASIIANVKASLVQ